jgi:hypothetical protein
MISLRLADPSTVWIVEIARVWFLVFGCATAGGVIGFAMGYRRESLTELPVACSTRSDTSS